VGDAAMLIVGLRHADDVAGVSAAKQISFGAVPSEARFRTTTSEPVVQAPSADTRTQTASRAQSKAPMPEHTIHYHTNRYLQQDPPRHTKAASLRARRL
jgi:hypothetical protein